jgi:hypothetical protein
MSPLTKRTRTCRRTHTHAHTQTHLEIDSERITSDGNAQQCYTRHIEFRAHFAVREGFIV